MRKIQQKCTTMKIIIPVMIAVFALAAGTAFAQAGKTPKKIDGSISGSISVAPTDAYTLEQIGSRNCASLKVQVTIKAKGPNPLAPKVVVQTLTTNATGAMFKNGCQYMFTSVKFGSAELLTISIPDLRDPLGGSFGFSDSFEFMSDAVRNETITFHKRK
jgi:hypothetical protein